MNLVMIKYEVIYEFGSFKLYKSKEGREREGEGGEREKTIREAYF